MALLRRAATVLLGRSAGSSAPSAAAAPHSCCSSLAALQGPVSTAEGGQTRCFSAGAATGDAPPAHSPNPNGLTFEELSADKASYQKILDDVSPTQQRSRSSLSLSIPPHPVVPLLDPLLTRFEALLPPFSHVRTPPRLLAALPFAPSPPSPISHPLSDITAVLNNVTPLHPQARHQIFGTHIGDGQRSGRKVLRKALVAERMADWYMQPMTKFDPIFADPKDEQCGPRPVPPSF